MRVIWSLAGQAAKMALLGSTLRRLKRKTTRSAIGIALILVFGILGLVFLLAGIRVELDFRVGPVWSPILIGAVLIAVAGVCFLAFLKPRHVENAMVDAEHSVMQNRMMVPARRVEREIASSPLLSVGAAAGVGFLAAVLFSVLRRR